MPGITCSASLKNGRRPRDRQLLTRGQSRQLLTRDGPGRAIALPTLKNKINPKITVYCFHFAKPGTKGGLAGDALVHLGDHWAYFPKPFRWLR